MNLTRTRCVLSSFKSATVRSVACTNIKRHLHRTSFLQFEWSGDDIYYDPIKELEPLLQIPLLKEGEKVFDPSVEELKDAEELFRGKRRQPIKALKGVVNLGDLPSPELPEVAFVGRSNVGKSALIDALFFKTLTYKIPISKTPGRTRVLKFYNVGSKFSLVDMPGYGYNMPKYFVSSMEKYIHTRKTLCRIFLLIDGQFGLNSTDQRGIEMLEELGKPYVMVLTKVDKASHHGVLRNLLKILEYRDKHMHGCLPQPFLVSAHQDAGLAQLRALIAYVTGVMTIKGL